MKKPTRQAREKFRRGPILQIRLKDEEHRLLSQRAAMNNLSTATWARMVLLREAKNNQAQADR